MAPTWRAQASFSRSRRLLCGFMSPSPPLAPALYNQRQSQCSHVAPVFMQKTPYCLSSRRQGVACQTQTCGNVFGQRTLCTSAEGR